MNSPYPNLHLGAAPERLADASLRQAFVSATAAPKRLSVKTGTLGKNRWLGKVPSVEPATPDSVTAALADLEGALDEAAIESLPDALGDLARLQALTNLRLVRSQGDQSPAEVRLLDVNEAAERLRCSVSTLYKKADDFPFTVREGRSLRFSEGAISAWIRKRTR
jgi:predicted DNA-binding transcriptional regulator AlpA